MLQVDVLIKPHTFERHLVGKRANRRSGVREASRLRWCYYRRTNLNVEDCTLGQRLAG